MIKRAYSKALRLLLPIGIVSAFIPAGVSAFLAFTKTTPSSIFLFTFVGFAVFILAAFVFLSAATLISIALFHRALSKINPLELQMVESDFLKEDCFRDLYFTKTGLVVHQLRRGLKIQLRYIPYKNIIGVTNLPKKAFSAHCLEILTYEPFKNCKMTSAEPITLKEIIYINEKIENIRLGFKAAGESSEIYFEKHNLFKIIRNSPLILIVGTFLVVSLYLLGILGLIVLPKIILSYEDFAANATGHSLFWPGLIFLLWTAAAIAMEIMLILRSLFKMSEAEQTRRFNIYIGIVSFSVLSAGFILFIAVLYGMDSHILGKMAQGFWLILGI
ncbi:MAG: hypothetical protein HFE62_03115 [Firmicutes bacterium]|nr:hypothetical protein [Bacillota bacterium]